MRDKSPRETLVDGCCSTEFNTNYPPQLNGIISPNEFRESIAKINAVNRSGVPLLICLAIFLVCVITGIVLCVLGTTTSSSSGSAGFAVLTGVGGGIIALGIVSVIVSCCFIHIMLRKRLEPVVAEEEARYASRSATPCRWRLNPKTREPGDPYVRRGCGVNYVSDRWREIYSMHLFFSRDSRSSSILLMVHKLGSVSL